jgi:hypothetical protein
MRFEYPEVYEELFMSQLEALEKLLSKKMEAIDHLEQERCKEESIKQAKNLLKAPAESLFRALSKVKE